MEHRFSYRYLIEIIELKVFLPLAMLVFAGLYLLSSADLAWGFVYGVGIAILDLWLMVESLEAVFNNYKKKGIQWAVPGAYLARYLLIGVLLWVSTRVDGLNLFAAAGGVMLPRLAIWASGIRGRQR